MNKVYLRKTNIWTEMGNATFSERLDINIEQEGSKGFRHCSFSFRSQVSGIANIEGHVEFAETYGDKLTHSSGSISEEVITNFKTFSALQLRLETLCITGLPKSDEQIFSDPKIQLILKNNNFKEVKTS